MDVLHGYFARILLKWNKKCSNIEHLALQYVCHGGSVRNTSASGSKYHSKNLWIHVSTGCERTASRFGRLATGDMNVDERQRMPGWNIGALVKNQIPVVSIYLYVKMYVQMVGHLIRPAVHGHVCSAARGIWALAVQYRVHILSQLNPVHTLATLFSLWRAESDTWTPWSTGFRGRGVQWL
jgi:hypothetical protein